MLISAFLRGLGLGASLIIAIGAQNSFVLRQGLKRQHQFTVALTCTLCDAALIGLGTAGFGSLISRDPSWTRIAAWAGAAFLLCYGAKSFWAALRPGALEMEEQPAASGVNIVAATLALSLLNPHVYLDTVVLVGGLSAQYAPHPRLAFGLGAMLASLLWFFSLAYGAALLIPLFRRPAAWRVLDMFIGVVMWSLAASLALGTS